MNLMLFAIIILQFGYIIYKDQTSAKEREKLQLKLMSKDVVEYKHIIEKEEEPPSMESDPYIEIEVVDVEKILKAKDLT